MQQIALETMQGTVIVREGALSDAEKFRGLRLDALQDSPFAFPVDYEETFNHPTSFWENRLEPDDTGTIFFAEHNHDFIGMTGIRKRGQPKTRHSAEIWGVYVRPAWRGLRIAESLIEACIDWARSNHVKILKLGVTATSIAAIRCYQRCGFIIYGIEPRGIFYDGKYYDGYLMYRSLDT